MHKLLTGSKTNIIEVAISYLSRDGGHCWPEVRGGVEMRFFHPSWAQGAGRRGEGRGMEDKEDRHTHTHTKNPLNPKRLQHGTDSVYCCDSSLISPVFLEQLLPPFELFAQIKKIIFRGKCYSHGLGSIWNASCPVVLHAKNRTD